MMRLTLAALAACFAFAGSAAAQAVPPGSYQESCRDARIEGDKLHAECKDDAGKWKKTWLQGYRYCDGDIVNENGLLKCNGGRLTEDEANGPAGSAARGELPPGPWRETCREGVLDGSVLRASCVDRNGVWRSAWIDLGQCTGEIGNVDGQLVCLLAAAPQSAAAPKLLAMRDTLPTGKWVQFCRAATLSNYVMRAECYAGDGRWQSSDLDLSTCSSTDVTSNGGRLACQ